MVVSSMVSAATSATAAIVAFPVELTWVQYNNNNVYDMKNCHAIIVPSYCPYLNVPCGFLS